MLDELLAGAGAAARRGRSSCAGACTPTPSSRTHEHRTAAAVAAELPVAGRVRRGDRAARPRAGERARARSRCAPSSTGCRSRSARGAPFSARGETMHACGHDVHIAALVALVARGGGPRRAAAGAAAGDLPALRGGLSLGRAADRRAGPRRARAAGGASRAHIHPELPWGSVALDAGAVNASCDAIEITIEGEPTHGAYPHRGRDPVLALCEAVLALQAAAGRRVDPLHPATVTIGVLEAGSAENVIPAPARARGALRAHRARGPRGAARARRRGRRRRRRRPRLPRRGAR